jgi:preprotein translocase SecF subunit
MAGLLINLYTAVTVTRMCYNAIGNRTSDINLLKMCSAIKETNIDFIKIWKVALSVSLLVIGVSWAVMVMHGAKDPSKVFGVDFMGGTSLKMSFQEKAPVEAVRKALDEGGTGEAMIQYQKAMESGAKEVLEVKVSSVKSGERAIQVLSEKFPAAGFKIMQQDDVGPQVGKELKSKAMWALGLAMVAMIIYIGIRFEFGFGLGAVVAIFHDVLMTIGICHLFGFQLSMTIMAAVLTIIGYSVNDTIVIFDRIRENLRLYRNKTFVEICNLSVNQTLARTLLTNAFTFVSVLFLLTLGGGSIKDFSFAMFVGMIAGTYSTVYIATPVVLLWHKFERPDMGKK